MFIQLALPGRAAIPAITLCATLALAGCREGVPPFAVDRDPVAGPDGAIQLTYNTARDFSPTWSRGSDTVYYTTTKFADATKLASTVAQIGIGDGVARLLAPGAQNDSLVHLVLPAASPAGDRFAYVHIPFINVPAVCGGMPAPECVNTEPLLMNGFVRVRNVGAGTPAPLDASMSVTFPGGDPARNQGGAARYFQKLFPFQASFRDRGEFLFRPTWASDSRRVAFSDGLELHIWDTSGNSAAAVPGVTDAVSAAWRPNSEMIAFTRLVRGDSVHAVCACAEPASPLSSVPHDRWVYQVTRSAIAVVNTDGTGLTEIAEGQDPAWSPDGNAIYFSRSSMIYRATFTNGVAGTPEAIPGTIGGTTPSISPDGKWLAFTRQAPDDDTNIWVLPIDRP